MYTNKFIYFCSECILSEYERKFMPELGKNPLDMFLIPPVGWGFMLIHEWRYWREQGVIVTDGGSVCPSYEVLHNLKYAPHISSRLSEPWVWIISHLDYDHYSLVLALIEKLKWWQKPSAIILPASYNLKECMKAAVMYLMLADLLAILMKIPPVYKEEIIPILSEARSRGALLGVYRGKTLRAGDVEYHILWPPHQFDGKTCCGLANELERKFNMYIEKYARELDQYKHDNIQEYQEKYWKLLEKISPIVDERRVIDLDEVLNREELQRKDIERAETLLFEQKQRGPYSFNWLYINAARRFNDTELLKIHNSYVNAFSTAFIVSSTSSRDKVKLYFYSTSNLMFRPLLTLTASTTTPNLILYLADLKGKELDEAIQYCFNNNCKVFMLVAPHHGNSYRKSLSQIESEILVASRCDNKGHVRYGLGNPIRLICKTDTFPLITQHSHGVIIEW